MSAQLLPKLIAVAGFAVIAAVIIITRRAWVPGIGHAVPSLWRIAKITVAEARRRRVLQVAIVLVVLVFMSMNFFSYLSPEEQSRMLISGGLSAITVFGILLAIFVAAFLIPGEIDKRTIYAVLSKPVRRFEFVLGKYVGALIIIGALVAIMTVVLVAVLLIQDALVKDLPDSVFDPNIRAVVFASVMNYCSLCVLTAIIIFISSISSTTMTVIGALIVWAVGSMQSTLHDLAEHAVGLSRATLLILYHVVPKLENFDFRHEASNLIPIHMLSAWNQILHGLGYVVVVLILAAIFFNDRQV